MIDGTSLTPASELAARSRASYPNESSTYREVRTALLAEEIELRRHVERVAAMRRQLPPGGEVPADYAFTGAEGPITLRDLFQDKETLVLYSMMYGPQRERPCPSCTSLLESWNGIARNFRERAAIAIVARSPINRLLAFQQERGWQHLRFFSDLSGDYTRAYVSTTDEDMPALNVFTRRDGVVRHFWGGEMGPETADPGQDPRGAPDTDPLWALLDLTPQGRGTDWYPQLEYGAESKTCHSSS